MEKLEDYPSQGFPPPGNRQPTQPRSDEGGVVIPIERPLGMRTARPWEWICDLGSHWGGHHALGSLTPSSPPGLL